MSILIRGMQMPSECRKCFMMHYAMTGETYCEVNGKTMAKNYRPIEFGGRPDWCPLVELPETCDTCKHSTDVYDSGFCDGCTQTNSNWELMWEGEE